VRKFPNENRFYSASSAIHGKETLGYIRIVVTTGKETLMCCRVKKEVPRKGKKPR
jgi:hypothetical protein